MELAAAARRGAGEGATDTGARAVRLERTRDAVFFEDLGLRLREYVLDVDVSSLGATLGDILRKTEAVLDAEQPDAFLVLGDTNSALSVIMAKRHRIPTYHMETGNRCFDANVPEEDQQAVGRSHR